MTILGKNQNYRLNGFGGIHGCYSCLCSSSSQQQQQQQQPPSSSSTTQPQRRDPPPFRPPLFEDPISADDPSSFE